MKNIITAVVTLVVLAFFSNAAIARDLSASEKDAVIKAVKSELIDSDSAKFKWGKIADRFTTETDNAYYCVLVNSKNSSGKFVGYRPIKFFLIWSKVEGFAATVVNMPDPQYPRDIYKFCSEDGYKDFSSAK